MQNIPLCAASAIWRWLTVLIFVKIWCQNWFVADDRFHQGCFNWDGNFARFTLYWHIVITWLGSHSNVGSWRRYFNHSLVSCACVHLRHLKLDHHHSALTGFWIKLQKPSTRPSQDWNSCFRGSEYILFEIQPLGHGIHQLGSLADSANMGSIG